MRTSTRLATSDSIFMRELRSVLQAIYSPTSDDSIHTIIQQYFDPSYTHDESNAILATERLRDLAEKILLLAEGNSRNETLTRSARVLAALQLTVPHSSKRWYEVHFSIKILYRTVLSLRLLMHMLENNQMKHDWILQQYQLQKTGDNNCPFRQNVQIPIIIAPLLMDSGQLHPDITDMLSGESKELDPLRNLQAEEREQFLVTNKSARLDVTKSILTALPQKANTRDERESDLLLQNKVLDFCRECLSKLDEPKSLLGNLLKIPQVYSSIVLPGRKRFVYEALPKAALLLRDAVKNSQLNGTLVDQLLTITGVFPQGYGIVFIPEQSTNILHEKYELAVVNQLYPPRAVEPLCRIVTNNLMFRKGGYNCRLSVANNLYFKVARKKLAVVPEHRLQNILSNLSADFHPGQLRHSLPRCWLPDQFFSQPEHQNLWNNAQVIEN